VKVDVNNYIELASRTNNPDYVAVRDRMDNKILLDVLNGALPPSIIGTSVLLDEVKKHIFYGRNLSQGNPMTTGINIKSLEGLQDSPYNIDILHGIFGIATESGELLEALVKFANGDQLDQKNLLEEIGDVFWYCAIILKRLGFTFEEAMEANINKLAKRFPDGFTEFHAINRDLNAESEVLTSHMKDTII
jgi:NTP pyrophosphatase (non-canonical NTP hydrolase)